MIRPVDGVDARVCETCKGGNRKINYANGMADCIKVCDYP